MTDKTVTLAELMEEVDDFHSHYQTLLQEQRGWIGRLKGALGDPRISINHLKECWFVQVLGSPPDACDCGRDEFRAEVARLLGKEE